MPYGTSSFEKHGRAASEPTFSLRELNSAPDLVITCKYRFQSRFHLFVRVRVCEPRENDAVDLYVCEKSVNKSIV